MSSPRTAAALQALREQPLWQLLAATKAPAVVALLRTVLFEAEQSLPSSVLQERLLRELNALRDAGHELPQTPAAYLADWLRQGWLQRRLPEGASEEVYSLSVDAADAIRFLGGRLRPQSSATESRLATVIQQLTRLADETDSNPERRIATLQAERARIDAELAALRGGVVRTLPDDRALERSREVIALADELAGDFRRVRDDFDRLNRSLRQSLVEHDGSRGQVLEQLFAGVDLIADSDAGRTFNAFWRLLTDPGQSASLFEALEAIVGRPFARQLSARERRFLLDLTATLMNEGSAVHDVLQHFARSLKAFVQSREFREQRRLQALLREAAQAALQAKEQVRANQPLGFAITLTSSRVRSVSQWQLHDPAQRLAETSMPTEGQPTLSLAAVAELVRQSEIDFRSLRAHIRTALAASPQVSVAQLLQQFPAAQGLGSVVGYVARARAMASWHRAASRCNGWAPTPPGAPPACRSSTSSGSVCLNSSTEPGPTSTDADSAADATDGHAHHGFAGDTGTLALDTRRVLVQLLLGPAIDATRQRRLWPVLLRDEAVLRSRLHDLFLDLVVDVEQQVAFTRQVVADDIDAPVLLRKSPLSFLDSALVLFLRQRLTQAEAQGERAVVSADEMAAQLSVFERSANPDQARFGRQVASAIEKAKKLNLVRLLGGGDQRFEVSPTLKLLFPAEQIQALTHTYRALADGSAVLPSALAAEDDDDDSPEADA